MFFLVISGTWESITRKQLLISVSNLQGKSLNPNSCFLSSWKAQLRIQMKTDMKSSSSTNSLLPAHMRKTLHGEGGCLCDSCTVSVFQKGVFSICFLSDDLWSPLGWAGYMMAACVCYYSLSLVALSISSRIKKHCPAFSPAPNSLLLRVDFLSRRWTFHHEPLLDPSLPLRAVLPPALFLKYLPSHSHTYICQGHQQVTPSSSPSRQG